VSDSTIRDGLPFNLDDLINLRNIEGNRIEFKATWDDPIKEAVVRTVCAFANDLLNLGGGYVVLGIDEEGGQPILPPRGLEGFDLEQLQKKIWEACYYIQPSYQPILFPASYQDIPIMIIWAPGGDNRAYEAPEHLVKGSPRHFYVRHGPQTVIAKGKMLQQLLESAAKIPFDDRRHPEAKLEDLSLSLVRRFLQDIRSELITGGQPIREEELYRRIHIIAKVDDHEVPRNVGLLFFSEDPDHFFPGARIEVVQFGDDAGGDLIEERAFRGPLNIQVKNTLDYLDSLGGTLLKKIPGQAEVERTVPYPYEAMEESIVNAVYHRGYDAPPEPVKVYLYPDRMEITSCPGPVFGITQEHFRPGRSIPAVPARNRRIGEFLKELRLAEGRGTGIPKIQRKMKENGSPEAQFDFDDQRTYFRVTLPVHPRYQVLHALREAAHLWATGAKQQGLAHLQRAFISQPNSGALASQIIEYAFAAENETLARETFEEFKKQKLRSEATQPFLTLARVLIDKKRAEEARSILKDLPAVGTPSEILEAAVLRKRMGDLKGAHRLFEKAYSLNPDDPKIVHEFAQTKMGLARALQGPRNIVEKKRLNKEASELLRRAIQLADHPVREAWCWYDLAKALEWLREPRTEIEEAILKARSLLPEEPRFQEWYERWKTQNSHKHRTNRNH